MQLRSKDGIALGRITLWQTVTNSTRKMHRVFLGLPGAPPPAPVGIRVVITCDWISARCGTSGEFWDSQSSKVFASVALGERLRFV